MARVMRSNDQFLSNVQGVEMRYANGVRGAKHGNPHCNVCLLGNCNVDPGHGSQIPCAVELFKIQFAAVAIH